MRSTRFRAPRHHEHEPLAPTPKRCHTAGPSEFNIPTQALALPENAVALGGIDFPAFATAMGCYGIAIDDVAGLTDAIETAFDADRPMLLHIREHSRATQTELG